MSLFKVGSLKKHIYNIMRPFTPMSLVKWVEGKRILASVSSSESGKFDLSRTPYQIGILEALENPKIEELALMKSTQIGASECVVNYIGWLIDQVGGTLLMVLPIEDSCRKFSSQRLEPLIEGHYFLKDKIQNNYKKTDNKLVKVFDGGLITIVPSKSTNSIRTLPCDVVILDEIGKYVCTEEGEVYDIVKGRFNAKKKKNIFALSSPGIKGSCPIWELWLVGDQQEYFVPCPECNEMHYFKFEDFVWENDDPKTVRWKCPSCSALIEENKKQQMMIKGKWISTLSEEQKKGRSTSMHINAFYSPLGWSASSWPAIIKEYLEIHSTETKNQVFTNVYLGLPWSPEKAKAPEAEVLFNRKENYKKNVILPPYYLVVAGADVQQDRIEACVVAYDPETLGSQCLDYRVFLADQDTSNIDDACYHQLAAMLNEGWPIEGSSATVPLLAMCIDSSYQTQSVYSFCRSVKSKKLFPVRGQEQLNCAVSSPKMADAYINSKRIRQTVRYYGVGTSILKAQLYGWLNQEPPKQGEKYPYGYCRFPNFDLPFFQMLASEHLVTKKVGSRVKYIWEKKEKRNEALDCMVYSYAAFCLAGGERLSSNPEQLEEFKRRVFAGELE